MAKQQRTVLVASNILLAVVLIAIWLLTVQTPQDTTALSTPWAQALSPAFGWPLGFAAWVARKVVHTVEFFPVGLLMALAAYNLPQAKGISHNRVLAAVVIVCFACSLGDQIHKMFVPGREFDALDMCFDAAGYVLGALIARAIAARQR